MRRTLMLLSAAVVPLAMLVPSAAAGSGQVSAAAPGLSAASGGGDGTVGLAAARAMRQGYLVPNQRAYAQSKAAAAHALTSGTRQPQTSSAAPTTGVSWDGLTDPNYTPSDSTGAIGTTRYIETVNSKVGIYTRTGSLINSDSLDNLFGESGNSNFDPQVMWDAKTKRFYYAGDSVASTVDNRLAYGFSKTASPSNATTDWCHYQVGYGSDFPDYPKLGDSTRFAIIGVNVFTGNTFTGSDIVALGKAPSAAPVSTCPDASTLAFGSGTDLKMADGVTPAFTPVPAAEVDSKTTGYAVARALSLPATSLTIFKVTAALDGSPVVGTVGKNVSVPSYSIPPAAPQSGTSRTIDTSDTRPTQAIAAVDPSKGNALALWTQHTVAGGAGAEVRWYEINPANATVLRQGKVTSSTLYSFNGAISPDRVVNGTTKAFGSNMVLGYNTSSSSTFPAISMVSQVADGPQSAPTTVKSSASFNSDYSCDAVTPDCRWGDYAAATPDPGAPVTGLTGRVWLTSMWTVAGPTTNANWKTWNWSATP